MATRTLSVVFTDIKGFTQRTSNFSRAELRDLLDRHEELLLPVIRHYDGTVIKTIGDAFLLTFESPTNAVLCGLMIQETLREFNAEMDELEQIEVRVAINTGEVEVRGSDVFGETVNIAARIEGITEAGEVYFTHATYLSMNKSEVPTSEVGERRLKGIDEPIRVYRVIRDENVAGYQRLIESERAGRALSVAPDNLARQPKRPARRGKALWVVGATVMVVLVLAIWAPAKYQQFKTHQELSELEVEIKQARTRHDEDTAYQRVNDIAARVAADQALLYRIALMNGNHPYWRRFAFSQVTTLMTKNAAYQADQQLGDLLIQSLGYLDPDESSPDSEDVRLRHFMATTMVAQWKDRLLSMVHDPGVAERIERRNAYLILEQSDTKEEVDLDRYFALELWGDVRTGDPWNERVFSYFETEIAANPTPARAAWLPVQELPEYLQYFNSETDRVVHILANRFAEPLRARLEKAVTEKDLGFRVHAWQVLAKRGWQTTDLERLYQHANLFDYWKGYTASWVVDAIIYYGNQEPASVPEDVRAKIKLILSETAEIITSGKVPDRRQSMADYTARLIASQNALAAFHLTPSP